MTRAVDMKKDPFAKTPGSVEHADASPTLPASYASSIFGEEVKVIRM